MSIRFAVAASIFHFFFPFFFEETSAQDERQKTALDVSPKYLRAIKHRMYMSSRGSTRVKLKCAFIASPQTAHSQRFLSRFFSFFFCFFSRVLIKYLSREGLDITPLSEKYSLVHAHAKNIENILRDATLLSPFSITYLLLHTLHTHIFFFALLEEIRSLPRPRYFGRFTFFATRTGRDEM